MSNQQLDLVAHVMHKWDQMRTDRNMFERDWYDIRDLVRPVVGGYNRVTGQFVTYRTGLMNDGTAPEALETLGATLHSYITNPTERWFELQIEGGYDLTFDPDAVEWLQLVSDLIYSSYQREDVTINQALFECYLDVCSYGTCVLYQDWSDKLKDISLQAHPVVECFVQENSEGRIDTLFRRREWSIRQLRQEFGELPPQLARVKDEDKVFECLHCVFPRTNQLPGRNPLSTSKPFASLWVCTNTKEILSEGGYDTMPYHAARWTKLAGETYGRGPASKCLPDIKMINSMERTLLKAGQKVVDPPLQLNDEGFLLPIRTEPGALIFREAGTEPIEPLATGANLPWGIEQANQKRDFIRRCFYAEWIHLEKEDVEMTAYEVADRREEKLRLMAPMLGRLVSELHGPMIQRTYYLLRDHGRIPPAPETLRGRFLSVGYLSPASRAQTGMRAMSMGRFLQELLPAAQVAPGVLDIIDWDAYARELARARGTPIVILRSQEEIMQMRKQKQLEQAAANVAAVAEPASKAIKNLADANAKGGIPQLEGIGV